MNPGQYLDPGFGGGHSIYDALRGGAGRASEGEGLQPSHIPPLLGLLCFVLLPVIVFPGWGAARWIRLTWLDWSDPLPARVEASDVDYDGQLKWWEEQAREPFKQKRYEELKRRSEGAIREHPKHAEAWLWLGYAQWKLGERVQAIRTLKRARRLRGPQGHLWRCELLISYAYEELGMLKIALEWARRAARHELANPDIRRQLADLCAKLGNGDMAELQKSIAASLEEGALTTWWGVTFVVAGYGLLIWGAAVVAMAICGGCAWIVAFPVWVWYALHLADPFVFLGRF